MYGIAILVSFGGGAAFALLLSEKKEKMAIAAVVLSMAACTVIQYLGSF
jgi:uncharacterized membrane protein YebE (DUF533 family)